MKTVDALYQQFGTKFVNVVEYARAYCGLNDEKNIIRLANEGKLGVKAFKAYEGNKAPMLVDIEHVAAFLDSKSKG
jgi:hypothetical protein